MVTVRKQEQARLCGKEYQRALDRLWPRNGVVYSYGKKKRIQSQIVLSSILLSRDATEFVSNNSDRQCLHIPSCVEKVDSMRFDKRKIKCIVMPQGVQKITEDTFKFGYKLQKVIFPDNSLLTEFKGMVFYGCETIEKLVLPGKLQCVDLGCFH